MAMTVEELMAKLSAASLGLPGPRSCSVPCKVEDDDQDIVSILAVLGADPKSFRREEEASRQTDSLGGLLPSPRDECPQAHD